MVHLPPFVRFQFARKALVTSAAGKTFPQTEKIPGQTPRDLAVSKNYSAAYLTANTLVEVIGAKIFTKVNDGYMYLKLESNFEEAQISLMGLELHLKELAKQYRKQISFISEV